MFILSVITKELLKISVIIIDIIALPFWKSNNGDIVEKYDGKW